MPMRPKQHKPFRLPSARPPDNRPTAHARGYNARWRRYRLMFLREHPLCATPGCNRAATDVDHVKAVTGPDDPNFYNEDNLQALCHSCHSRKTVREDGGRPRRSGI